MKSVDQVKHNPEEGVIGDCCRSSVCSLLGIEKDDVPHFILRRDGKLNMSWRAALEKWLAKRGLALIPIWPSSAPSCLYLAVGPTVRSKYVEDTHMVVMRSGLLIHDPHEDRHGLLGVTHAWIIVPMEMDQWHRKET